MWDWADDSFGDEKVYLVSTEVVRNDYFEFREKRKQPIPSDVAFGIQFSALFPKLLNGRVEKAKNGRAISLLDMTCHGTFIQRRLEPWRVLRRGARVEQHAIGGAGRGCAADRVLWRDWRHRPPV